MNCPHKIGQIEIRGDDKHLQTKSRFLQFRDMRLFRAKKNGCSDVKSFFTFCCTRGHLRSALEITNGSGPEDNSWTRVFVMKCIGFQRPYE